MQLLQSLGPTFTYAVVRMTWSMLGACGSLWRGLTPVQRTTVASGRTSRRCWQHAGHLGRRPWAAGCSSAAATRSPRARTTTASCPSAPRRLWTSLRAPGCRYLRWVRTDLATVLEPFVELHLSAAASASPSRSLPRSASTGRQAPGSGSRPCGSHGTRTRWRSWRAASTPAGAGTRTRNASRRRRHQSALTQTPASGECFPSCWSPEHLPRQPSSLRAMQPYECMARSRHSLLRGFSPASLPLLSAVHAALVE
mmetsp:Transcript_108362/g.317036  ORF Transcript_108362/g.317036 Transcript_108362/m.317036 type:complete len:254 (+) Transcript_108362:604-1365(+)